MPSVGVVSSSISVNTLNTRKFVDFGGEPFVSAIMMGMGRVSSVTKQAQLGLWASFCQHEFRE